MDLSRHKFFDEYDGVDDDDGVIVAGAVFGKHKFDFYHQLIDYNVAAGLAAVAVGSDSFDQQPECKLIGSVDRWALLKYNVVVDAVAVVVVLVDCDWLVVVSLVLVVCYSLNRMYDSLGYFGFEHKSFYQGWAIDVQLTYYLVLFLHLIAPLNSNSVVASSTQLFEELN